MGTCDRIQLDLSEDRLEARLSIDAGEAEPRAVLDRFLADASVCAGIDPDALEAAATALESTEALARPLRIATGCAPAVGAPARLELIAPTELLPGTPRSDDSLDYRERQLILPVREGDLLGHLRPEVSGKPGFDVLGEAIPAPEFPEFECKLGDGVRLDDSGKIRALRDGARTVGMDGLLDVVETHKHDGHVDLASGNLRTRGSLEITRDVGVGMHVEVESDLAVGGTVDGATLVAGNGIVIAGGAIGRDLGSVEAGADLVVRHALGIRLTAGGALIVKRSVTNAMLIGKTIEVEGKLLGLEARAEDRILAREAGSPAGGPCLLRAAFPIEALDRIGSHATRPRSGGRAPKRAKQGSLAARKSKGKKTPRATGPEKAVGAAKIREQIGWRERERRLRSTAIIEISETAHPGCRIDFGGRPLVLERAYKKTRFRYDVEDDLIVAEENVQ